MINTNSSNYYNITQHTVGTHIKFLIGKGNICLYGLYMYDTINICHQIRLWLYKNPEFTGSWNNTSMYILSNNIESFDIALDDIDSNEFILLLTSNSDFQLELFNKYKNKPISKKNYKTSLIIEYENLKYIKYIIPRLLKLVVDSKLIPQKELLYLSEFYYGLDVLI
jgi:hypothetical protein